jgi:hypothetical protein
LKTHEAYLLQRIDGKIIKNLFSRIKINQNGSYSLLCLEGLEVGEYELMYNFEANQ